MDATTLDHFEHESLLPNMDYHLPSNAVMAVYRSIKVENSLITKQDTAVNGGLHHFLLCYPITKLLTSATVIPVKFLHACDFVRTELV
jgi:hypothetical protein